MSLFQCHSCGVEPRAVDPNDVGCEWPDGRTGCWSGADDGSHTCAACGDRLGYASDEEAMAADPTVAAEVDRALDRLKTRQP